MFLISSTKQFPFKMIMVVIILSSMFFGFLFLKSILFKLSPSTSIATGVLVDHHISSRRYKSYVVSSSSGGSYSTYKFYANEEAYYCTVYYSSRFTSNPDKEIDIYYKESNPNINKPGKHSNSTNDKLYAMLSVPLTILFIKFVPKKKY